MSVNTYSVSSVQKFIEKSVQCFVEPRSVASLLPFGKYAQELLQSAALLEQPFTILQTLPGDHFVTVDDVPLIVAATAYQADTPTTIYTNAILSAAHQALVGKVVKFNPDMVYSSPTVFSSVLAFYITSLFVIASTGPILKPVNIPILKSLFSDFYVAGGVVTCDTAEEYANKAYDSLHDVYYPNGAYLSKENDILFSADYFHVVEGSLIDICPMKDCKPRCKPEPHCKDRRKDCGLSDIREQKYKLFSDCVVPAGFYRSFGCEKTIASRFKVNDPSAVDFYTRSCNIKK